jgi:hypothetical protein
MGYFVFMCDNERGFQETGQNVFVLKTLNSCWPLARWIRELTLAAWVAAAFLRKQKANWHVLRIYAASES